MQKLKAVCKNTVYDVFTLDFVSRKVGLGFYDDSYCGVKWMSLDDCKLLMPTGCKDRAGNDIFEGDVISSNVHDHCVVKSVPHFWLNIYKACASEGADPVSELRITGNIFEKPTLSILKSSGTFAAVANPEPDSAESAEEG